MAEDSEMEAKHLQEFGKYFLPRIYYIDSNDRTPWCSIDLFVARDDRYRCVITRQWHMHDTLYNRLNRMQGK